MCLNVEQNVTPTGQRLWICVDMMVWYGMVYTPGLKTRLTLSLWINPRTALWKMFKIGMNNLVVKVFISLSLVDIEIWFIHHFQVKIFRCAIYWYQSKCDIRFSASDLYIQGNFVLSLLIFHIIYFNYLSFIYYFLFVTQSISCDHIKHSIISFQS